MFLFISGSIISSTFTTYSQVNRSEKTFLYYRKGEREDRTYFNQTPMQTIMTQFLIHNNHSHTLNQALENNPESELDGMMKNQKLNSDPTTEADKHQARHSSVSEKKVKNKTTFVYCLCGVPLHLEGCCYTWYHNIEVN